MTRLLRGMTVIAVLILIAGCATKPAIPYDRTSESSVKTIGLLTPGTPSGPRVILATTVGQSFGLIGALIDAGMEESRNSDLEALLSGQQFSTDKALSEGLSKALKARGYDVVEVPVARQAAGELQKTYPGANPQVDAYLDVVISYGYLSAGIAGKTPYRPYMHAKCRLVKAADSSVLMEDMVLYNALNAPEGHVVLSPDVKYEFPEFADVTRDPKLTTEGVSVAFASGTDAIGQLLK